MTGARIGSDWQIVMAPSKGGLWLVLLMVWAFAGCVYALWRFAADEVNPLGYALIFAFPALISFYGLRGIYGDNGKLVLQRDGFRLTGPSGSSEFFRWDQVERFGTHIFGDSVVTKTGVVTARFSYRDPEGGPAMVGLANSLRFSGDDLAKIMEYARIEAARGWPEPPLDQTALAMAALGHSGRTRQSRRLAPRSTGAGSP